MPTEADTYTDLYRLSKDDKVESWGLVPAGGLMTKCGDGGTLMGAYTLLPTIAALSVTAGLF